MENSRFGENTVSEKKKKGKLMIIIPVAVFVIAAIVTASVLYLNMKSEKDYKIFIRHCEEKDFSEAAEIWKNGNINGKEKSDAEEYIVSIAEETYEEFRNDKLSYHNAKKMIDFAGEICPDRDLKQKLEKMNKSKKAYQDGLNLEYQGKFMEAVSEYEKVLGNDPKREDAEKKIEECYESYKDYIVEQLEKNRISADFEAALILIDKYEEEGGTESDVLDYRKIFEYMQEDGRNKGKENYYPDTTALTFESVTSDMCFGTDTSADGKTVYRYISSVGHFTQYINHMKERGWRLSEKENTDTVIDYDLFKGDETLSVTYFSDRAEVWIS